MGPVPYASKMDLDRLQLQAIWQVVARGTIRAVIVYDDARLVRG